MTDPATIFWALSHPYRLAILHLIGKQDGHLTAQMIEKRLRTEYGITLTQPTVSHHLQPLDHAGLITYQKSGQYRYYRLVPDGWKQAQQALAHYGPKLKETKP